MKSAVLFGWIIPMLPYAYCSSRHCMEMEAVIMCDSVIFMCFSVMCWLHACKMHRCLFTVSGLPTLVNCQEGHTPSPVPVHSPTSIPVSSWVLVHHGRIADLVLALTFLEFDSKVSTTGQSRKLNKRRFNTYRPETTRLYWKRYQRNGIHLTDKLCHRTH